MGLTAGIVFARWAEVWWPAGFLAAGVLLAAAARWRGPRAVLLGGFWVVLGASLLSWRMDDGDGRDLRLVFGGEPELVTVRGVLRGDPERRVLERDAKTRHRTTARVAVREVGQGGEWRAATGDVAVMTTGFVGEEFVAGAGVEVYGVLARPEGPMAPGLFDFGNYLRWQRIFFSLRAESTNDWKLAARAEGWSSARFYRGFNEWARRTLQRGIPEDENTRLLWAMALGWRPGLSNEVSEPFMRTGTLHVFAISGLHIAMIAGMLVGFQRGLWFPKAFVNLWIANTPEVNLGLSRVAAGAITIPLIWFYTAATGWQASAIRATIMSTVIIIGWGLRQPGNLLNSLSITGLIILVLQPEQLFQVGFQLSFLLLLSIAVWPGMGPDAPWHALSIHLGEKAPGEFEFKPKVNWWTRILAKIFGFSTGHDPLLPRDLRPKGRRLPDGAAAWILGGFNLSIASMVGSLPVIALYFHLISFSSVLANLVIVPISGIALGGSLASMALAPIPGVSEGLNWISWWAMRVMVEICRGLEEHRWTYEYVAAPGWFLVAAYYGMLAALVLGWRMRFKVGWAAVFLAAAAGAFWKEQGMTRITALPGTGVIFVDAPGNKNDFLVDCGRDREAAALVKPFLRSQGVDRLAGILLTHGDVAHCEGYERLAKEFDVEMTFTSAARSRSPKYREVIRMLEEVPRKWRKAAAGDEVMGWTVMHPQAGGDFGKADDEAVVLRRRLEGRDVILLSELGRDGQQKMLESGRELRSAVAVGGAPTDGAIARPELMAQIAPEVFVLTGHDAKAQRAEEDLRDRGERTLTTREGPAVTITAREGRVTLETMAGARTEIGR